MCIRNVVQYSCRSQHMVLSTYEPFTLCEKAEHYPIPRQCPDVENKVVHKSKAPCWRCAKNEPGRVGLKEDPDWNETWRGGSRWTGYHVGGGKDDWRDNIPQ